MKINFAMGVAHDRRIVAASKIHPIQKVLKNIINKEEQILTFYAQNKVFLDKTSKTK